MKITPEDMDHVRAVLHRFETNLHLNPTEPTYVNELRDTGLALILVDIYDRGYKEGHSDGWIQRGEVDAELTMANTGECPYTFSHTRHWCGYRGCRDS